MTSSGTYNLALSNADIFSEGFARCGIRPAAFTTQQIIDGTRAINLALVKFGVLIPNLWASEQISQVLTAGTTTYTLPARAIMILSCFIRTGSGDSQIDRMTWPVSEFEYASFSTKNAQGVPSVYWFNRLSTPTISFFLTPDDTTTYTAYLQVARQLQDANIAYPETPDVPVRFLDALCAEVALRLGRYYALDRYPMLKADAQEAWQIAATNDTENVELAIQPGISGYFN